MRNYIRFLPILLLLILVSVGAVSAADDVAVNDGNLGISLASSNHVVNESNYDKFFDSEGKATDKIATGDTVILSGKFNGKSFIFNKTVNFNGNNTVIEKGTVKLLEGASGSHIFNLKIINNNTDNKQGIFLLGAKNCLIYKNDIYGSGVSSFPIALNLDSNNNTIYDNILKSGEISLSGTSKSTCTLVLGGAHNNIIRDNYLEVADANAIYFSAYGSGSFEGGKCNNNLVCNNTIKCSVVPTSWCYGIQLMGTNNTVIANRVNGTYRGISTGDKSIIKDNYVNVTGKDYSTNAIVGGDYAITAGSNSTISNNVINGVVVSAAIAAYGGCNVNNNTINTTGNGAGVQANGNDIKVSKNNIAVVSGAGVSQQGKYHGLSVVENEISTAGVGVLVSKISNKKVPSDIAITRNRISTTNQYAIDAGTADKKSYTISNNQVSSSAKIRTPEGIVEPITDFDFENGKIYNITPEDYHVYFDDAGNFINKDVFEGDTLNFINGKFINKTPKITYSFKVTGKNSTFENSTFTVTSDFVWFENLTIVNNHGWAIQANDTLKLMILNNTISVIDKKTAYAIYLNSVSNATVINNNLYSSGDYLTYTVLGLGLEDSIIENNTILTNGSGETHAYEASKCIDGVNRINEIYRTYGILLITSSKNQVRSNDVTVTSKLETPKATVNGGLSTNSLVGIDAYFDCNDNIFDGNTVSVCGNDNYIYGMGVIGAETNSGNTFSENNAFTNNTIEIEGKHYGSGLILGYHSKDNSVAENKIAVSSDDSAYGITLEFAKNTEVKGNDVSLKSNISYAVEMFEGDNNTIYGNNLTSNGNYGLGIGGYNSNNNVISENAISVNASGVKENGSNGHVDALGVKNAGIFFMAGSTENLIDNNTVTTNKGYAVDVDGLSNNVITNNQLRGEKFTGDRAVLGASGNTVKDNGPKAILVNATFKYFFDENGNLRDNVTDSTLEFNGEFANLSTNVITINRPVYLTSNNAVLKNMRFVIVEGANGTVIDGFTFITDLGNVVEIGANEVTVLNNIINASIANGKNNILINGSDVKGVKITDNKINLTGENAASTVNGVIDLEDVEDSLVANNTIVANIPSSDNVYGPAPDYKATYAGYAVQVNGKNNQIADNDISLSYSCVSGSYDSLYGILSTGDNSVIARNSIKGKGNSYIYGISAGGKKVLIYGNEITVFSSNKAANGISLNAPFEGNVSNNIVNLTAKSVAYGTNDFGNIVAVYEGNKFILSANSVYGMEFMGTDETAVNNEIHASGNFTLGIAAFPMDYDADELNVEIVNNKIFINGTGFGNATAGDMIPSMNVGIYVGGYIDSLIIDANKITANIPSCSYNYHSEAMYVTSDDAIIINNIINVTVSNIVGSYDSIYGVKLNGDGIKFNHNDVTVSGTNYAYGVKVSGDDYTMESNMINVTNDKNYANGISIDCPAEGIINDNDIAVKGLESAYGIASSSWGGKTVNGVYTNNRIHADAKTAYGLQLMGTSEKVYNNTVVADGEYAMGIATSTSEIEIEDNIIESNGAGEGSAETMDMFGASNQGVLLFGGDVKATILRNNITTAGEYSVNVLNGINNKSVVKYNYLVSKALWGDASVNGITGEVSDNVPSVWKIIANDAVIVKGKDSSFKVTVLDSLGRPVANAAVVFNIAGESKKYTRTTDSNGIATININRAVGKYTMIATLANVNASEPIQTANTITVKDNAWTIKGSDLVMTKGDVASFKVTVKDAKGEAVPNATVKFQFKGDKKVYARTTDSNGVATININRNPNIYTMVSSVTGPNGKTVQTTNKVTVKADTLTLKANNLVMAKGDGSVFAVKVTNSKGEVVANKKVSFQLVGEKKVYIRTTDSNGVASIDINRNVGEYKISYSAVDNQGKTVKANSKITINPSETVKTKDLTMTVGSKQAFKAIVTNAKGEVVANKKVSFQFVGEKKVYTRTTDSNGVASIDINRNVGVYTMIATLDNGYKATSTIRIVK